MTTLKANADNEALAHTFHFDRAMFPGSLSELGARNISPEV